MSTDPRLPTAAPATAAHPGAEMVERDRRRIAGSMGVSVTGQIVALAAGMLCMVATTRLLGPAGYGRLAMFFLFLEFLSQLLAWPNLGLVRFGREELAETGRLGRTFWARALLFGFSLGGVIVLLTATRGPIGRYLELDYPAALLLLLYVAMNETVFFARGVFQTVSDFRSFALVTAGIRALNLFTILGAFVLLRWEATPARVIVAQMVSVGVTMLVAAALLPWRTLRPTTLHRATLERVARYSWPAIFGGLAWLVVNWVDLVVIKACCAKAAVGIYAVAYQPMTVLTALHVAAMGALLPLVVSFAVEGRRASLLGYADNILREGAWLIGGACILLAALAEVIPLVLGADYAASVVPSQVLLAGWGFAAFGALQTVPMQALDRMRSSAAVLVIVAGVNLVLDLLLVPRIEILGAAVATTAAFALGALLNFLILNGIPAISSPRAGRRPLALTGLLPITAFAILATKLATPGLRLVAALGTLAVWAAAAWTAGAFRMSTFAGFRDMHMPGRVRAALGLFYRCLAWRDLPADEGSR